MSTDIVMQHSNDNYRCRHTGTYLPLTTFQWSICTLRTTLLCPLSMSEGWEWRQSNTLTRLSADPLTSMFTGAEAMSRQETCWFIFYFSQFCLCAPTNKESFCLVWNPANVIVHCLILWDILQIQLFDLHSLAFKGSLRGHSFPTIQ